MPVPQESKVLSDVPAWAKPHEMIRTGQLAPEQARQIDDRLTSMTRAPRVFSIAYGVIGVGLLAAAARGTRATPGLLVAGVLTLALAIVYGMIVAVRFGGVRSALRAGRVEAIRGVVTGAFTFQWRARGLDVYVGLDHRRYRMLAPSVRDCYRLADTVKSLATQKTAVIAYALPVKQLLVAIEKAASDESRRST